MYPFTFISFYLHYNEPWERMKLSCVVTEYVFPESRRRYSSCTVGKVFEERTGELLCRGLDKSWALSLNMVWSSLCCQTRSEENKNKIRPKNWAAKRRTLNRVNLNPSQQNGQHHMSSSWRCSPSLPGLCDEQACWWLREGLPVSFTIIHSTEHLAKVQYKLHCP